METAMDDAPRTPAAPGPLASFARFTALGCGVGLLSSGAVALLAEQLPWALANALITVASTLLCTELHARFTFGSGRHAGWRRHWQSAGSAAAAYLVTCAAMFVLHLVQSSPGALTEQAVYLGTSGLAGLARFLLLRLYVFATGRDRTAANGTWQLQRLQGMLEAPAAVGTLQQRQFALASS
jgi:putative flippase GtrA